MAQFLQGRKISKAVPSEKQQASCTARPQRKCAQYASFRGAAATKALKAHCTSPEMQAQPADAPTPELLAEGLQHGDNGQPHAQASDHARLKERNTEGSGRVGKELRNSQGARRCAVQCGKSAAGGKRARGQRDDGPDACTARNALQHGDGLQLGAVAGAAHEDAGAAPFTALAYIQERELGNRAETLHTAL